jgi:hypothetical protein
MAETGLARVIVAIAIAQGLRRFWAFIFSRRAGLYPSSNGGASLQSGDDPCLKRFPLPFHYLPAE